MIRDPGLNRVEKFLVFFPRNIYEVGRNFNVMTVKFITLSELSYMRQGLQVKQAIVRQNLED